MKAPGWLPSAQQEEREVRLKGKYPSYVIAIYTPETTEGKTTGTQKQSLRCELHNNYFIETQMPACVLWS